MQKTDPFCKHISKNLSNGKAPQHKTDLFTYVKGLLYKQIMDSGQKFLALVIPQVLEIYSSSGSPQQIRTSREHPYILLNKETILLEEY